MRGQAKAHPDDLLILGFAFERPGWPEFDRGQVILVDNLWSLEGRRFRHAYVTDFAAQQMHPTFAEVLYRASFKSKPGYGKALQAKDFRPHVEPSKWKRLGKRLLDLCERFA